MASTDTVAGATLLKHRHHHTKDHIADVLKTHSEDLSNWKASPWQPPRTLLNCSGDFCMGKHHSRFISKWKYNLKYNADRGY